MSEQGTEFNDQAIGIYPSGDSGFDSSGYGTSTQSIGAAPAVPAPAVVGSDGV